MRELTYSQPKPRYVKKKPGFRARVTAKKRRAEDPIKKAVRARCVELDGYCRFFDVPVLDHALAAIGQCSGRSEWMHLEDKKRHKTRGMEPEQRHTVAGSMMGCKTHHGMYDRGEIRLSLTTVGADGPIRVETDRGVYVIPARRQILEAE